MDFCASLTTACHVGYLRSSVLLAQIRPTICDNGETATMLTNRCSNRTLPLTALSTTDLAALRWLFILRLACAVIQYKIELVYSLNSDVSLLLQRPYLNIAATAYLHQIEYRDFLKAWVHLHLLIM